jgi:ABC-type transport system involved in multi-copper enzyme maturation permease subunit
MSAAPSTFKRAGSTAPAMPLPTGDRIAVPARWRNGQIALIGLVALAAIYYNLVGYLSPAGETRLGDSRSLTDTLGFLVLAAGIWLCTPTTGVIATTTWQEAIRRKWMVGLLGFAIVLMLLSTFFTWMQAGEEKKFLRDFGVGFTVIITLLMAIFLGIALIPPDIERRTIFTILSKPVSRAEFLLGKYLGLCLTLWTSLAAMSLMFLLSYAAFYIRREGLAGAFDTSAGSVGLAFELGNLARALLLHGGALMAMAAIAMTLSLVLSGIAGIVFSFLIFFLGQGASYWEYLANGGQSGKGSLSPFVGGVIKTVFLFVPRLDAFDVRQRLVNDMPIAFNYAWKSFGAGLVYSAAILFIAHWIWSEREF